MTWKKENINKKIKVTNFTVNNFLSNLKIIKKNNKKILVYHIMNMSRIQLRAIILHLCNKTKVILQKTNKN